jgi:hypothetical protein
VFWEASRLRDGLQAALVHGVALTILLWPLLGVEFVPMVDLPGHLAITRVLDDYLHGQYRTSLHLNVDPVYKPTYALLYAVFAVFPKRMVGPITVGVLVCSNYAAVCYAIAALGKRRASSPLVAALALVIGMFCFSSAFFWGLIPFLLSISPALIAYVSYLRASGIGEPARAPSGTKMHAIVFVLAAVTAHLVHPLSSFFLAIMLIPPIVGAVAFELVGGGKGVSRSARLWSIVSPLVVWASAVVALYLLSAPQSHELDLARSTAAVAAPFHGVAAARAFVAQIPIELGLLPTRNPASTFIGYPLAVALFLAASCTIALVTPARRPTTAVIGHPTIRLGTVFVGSALLFLFVRHDMVRVGIGALWFPVRGSAFVVFFFGVLAAAVLVRALDASRYVRLLSTVMIVAGLGIALQRSAVLRVHFLEFDSKVRGFFSGDVTERYFHRQPVTYDDHIRAYNCYFDDTCYDRSRLFFAIFPDATIYPLSITRPPSDEPH